MRHRFSANFVWALPLGNNVIARDWTLSGIYTAHTGHPFTVTQSSNNVGTNMTGLPNVSGDTDGPKTVDQWFNNAAFTAVTSGTFGNEQRNRLYGPGFQNFDLTVQRAHQARPASRGDAALGHLQRLQHRELRHPEQGHRDRGDVRDDHGPGERSAHDAARDQVRVLDGSVQLVARNGLLSSLGIAQAFSTQ